MDADATTDPPSASHDSYDSLICFNFGCHRMNEKGEKKKYGSYAYVLLNNLECVEFISKWDQADQYDLLFWLTQTKADICVSMNMVSLTNCMRTRLLWSFVSNRSYSDFAIGHTLWPIWIQKGRFVRHRNRSDAQLWHSRSIGYISSSQNFNRYQLICAIWAIHNRNQSVFYDFK